ncbi:MAG: hypothetical protein KatS3mg068_1133 [Candidatus Sericytochromatia bacterium]|nr:MAG: hypothetical protein KatS3mg068_1133 [Candidatus Sericytochromatia bacterium]
MTFRYVNKKNLVYFLHEIIKENGEKEYFFSRQPQKNNLDKIPDGYKVMEEANGKVIIKKINS